MSSDTAIKEEIKAFLDDFKIKMEYFKIIFLERDKNLQTLIDLEIIRVSRGDVLKNLQAEDYYKGPSRDVDHGPDLWEFGKIIKKKQIYIKITMGVYNRPVICISFHLAERPIKHPFK